MAEKHAAVSVTTATWQNFLQQLWNFVKNTQGGIVKFATDGSYYGIKSGGTIQTTDAGFGSGFGTNGDYIVIEPVNSYPGGGKWQVMFKANTFNSAAATACVVNVSWLGGWTQASDGFGTNQNTGDLQNWIHSAVSMTTSDTWYFSCSNSDTYNSSSGNQTYTYMRVLFYRNAATENSKFAGAYAGGYIPNEPDSDSKPVVMFFGQNSGNNTGWGLQSGGGRLPGNYAHNSSGATVLSFIGNASDVYTGYGLSRSGNWVNVPTLILDYNNVKTLGAFGRYTQMTGHLSRVDGGADSNSEYLVSADQMFRWKPSA